jgi:hypothetical protein
MAYHDSPPRAAVRTESPTRERGGREIPYQTIENAFVALNVAPDGGGQKVPLGSR